jgi:hypothetical protein
MGESEPGTVARPSPEGDGREGGKAAPGETTGSHGQLDSASGGYGSESGTGSSSGSGEGEPQSDDGSGADALGATGEAPTDWLRSAKPDA